LTYKPYTGERYENPDHQGYFNRILNHEDDKCLDCGNEIVMQEGCGFCPVCGFSKCG